VVVVVVVVVVVEVVVLGVGVESLRDVDDHFLPLGDVANTLSSPSSDAEADDDVVADVDEG